MIIEGAIISVIITFALVLASVIIMNSYEYIKSKFNKIKPKVDIVKTKNDKQTFNRDDLSKISNDAKFSRKNTDVIITMIEEEMLRLAKNKETSMDMKIVIREIPMGSIDFNYVDNLFSNDKKFKENFRITKNPGTYVNINIYAWW